MGEPNEEAKSNERSDYDGPLKAQSLALLPVLLTILGLNYEIINVKMLETQFKLYEDRRADIVFELLLADGTLLVVHVEIQSTNHPEMILRMGEYYFGIYRKTGKPPLQIVFYIGDDLNMENVHQAFDNYFRYNIIELRKVNVETLLGIDSPMAHILAPFADTPDKIETLRQTLLFLSELTDVNQARELLYVLLNLAPSIKSFDMKKTIFDITEEFAAENEKRNAALLFSTSFGKEKLREVHKEGKIEGKIEIAKRMLKQGHPIEIIAEATDLSIDEVKRLKTEF